MELVRNLCSRAESLAKSATQRGASTQCNTVQPGSLGVVHWSRFLYHPTTCLDRKLLFSPKASLNERDPLFQRSGARRTVKAFYFEARSGVVGATLIPAGSSHQQLGRARQPLSIGVCSGISLFSVQPVACQHASPRASLCRGLVAGGRNLYCNLSTFERVLKETQRNSGDSSQTSGPCVENDGSPTPFRRSSQAHVPVSQPSADERPSQRHCGKDCSEVASSRFAGSCKTSKAIADFSGSSFEGGRPSTVPDHQEAPHGETEWEEETDFERFRSFPRSVCGEPHLENSPEVLWECREECSDTSKDVVIRVSPMAMLEREERRTRPSTITKCEEDLRADVERSFNMLFSSSVTNESGGEKDLGTLDELPSQTVGARADSDSPVGLAVARFRASSPETDTPVIQESPFFFDPKVLREKLRRANDSRIPMTECGVNSGAVYEGAQEREQQLQNKWKTEGGKEQSEHLTPAQRFYAENKEKLLQRAQQHYVSKVRSQANIPRLSAEQFFDEESEWVQEDWQLEAAPVVRPPKNHLWSCGDEGPQIEAQDVELERHKMPSLEQLLNILQQEQMFDVQLVDLDKCGRRDIALLAILATGQTSSQCARVGGILVKIIKALGIPQISDVAYSWGSRQDEWVVAHLGPIHVHLMTRSARKLYRLEKLWLSPHEHFTPSEFPGFFDETLCLPPSYLFDEPPSPEAKKQSSDNLEGTEKAELENTEDCPTHTASLGTRPYNRLIEIVGGEGPLS